MRKNLGVALASIVVLASLPHLDAGRAGAAEALTEPIRINFQAEGAPTPCGWKADVGRVFGARGDLQYGWNFDHTDLGRDRGVKDSQLLDTLMHFHEGGEWEIKVPNGVHEVHVGIGDASYASTYFLNVEGMPFYWAQELDANEFRHVRHSVLVTDGRLTLDQGTAWDKATRINYIEINSPVGSRACPADKEPPEGSTTGGAGSVSHRPHGFKALKRTFGRPCNKKANRARTYYPSAGGRGRSGYVYYHSKLAKKIGGRVAAMRRGQKLGAADYGVWGYACRMKTGGTSWSVHSWGAALDTNTLRNPWGARTWNGRGANGKRYGRYLPELWMRQGFYWGLNFRDPMHFQYVTGY